MWIRIRKAPEYRFNTDPDPQHCIFVEAAFRIGFYCILILLFVTFTFLLCHKELLLYTVTKISDSGFISYPD